LYNEIGNDIGHLHVVRVPTKDIIVTIDTAETFVIYTMITLPIVIPHSFDDVLRYVRPSRN